MTDKDSLLGRRSSVADRLVALADEAGDTFWHTPDGDTFATVTLEHREHHRVASAAYRRWLARLMWRSDGRAPAPDAVRQALAVLEARARYDGEEHSTHLRVAGDGARVWLDLADPAWQVVEVTAQGWRVMPDPPVRFRRARGMLSLPAPVAGGDLKELREYIGDAGDSGWALLLGWLVASLCPRGPYPILLLHGPQGSGKSTTSRMLRRLIDPAQAELRSPPRDERDTAIGATNAWVLALDNLSGVSEWLSDALCRIATGGGFATRELYSDTEETILDATRPILCNGIDAISARGDLLDRGLLVTLRRVESYQPEADMWARFEESRPRLLGALLDAVAMALRCEATTVVPGTLRMADAARWVAAAEPALPVAPGTWVTAYSASRSEGEREALAASAVGEAVVALVAKGKWTGTAAELLEALSEYVGERMSRSKLWPGSPRALSSELRRLEPALQAAGVEVTHHRVPGGARRRLVTLSPRSSATDSPDGPDRPAASEDRDLQRDSDRPGAAPRKDSVGDDRDGRDDELPMSESLTADSQGALPW